MTSKYSDPTFTDVGPDSSAQALEWVNGSGDSFIYGLVASFNQSRKSNRKAGQYQYPVPVFWTPGQQDGPGTGEVKINWASWKKMEADVFGMRPLLNTTNLNLRTKVNGGEIVDQIVSLTIMDIKESDWTAPSGEPIDVTLQFNYLEFRSQGFQAYNVPPKSTDYVAVDIQILVYE